MCGAGEEARGENPLMRTFPSNYRFFVIIRSLSFSREHFTATKKPKYVILESLFLLDGDEFGNRIKTHCSFSSFISCDLLVPKTKSKSLWISIDRVKVTKRIYRNGFVEIGKCSSQISLFSLFSCISID